MPLKIGFGERPYKGNSVAAIARELRGLKERNGVFNTTFTHLDLPRENQPSQAQINAVAKSIEEKHELWWNSWIAPLIAELEAKGFK